MHKFFITKSSHVFLISIITFKIAFSLDLRSHYYLDNSPTLHQIERRQAKTCPKYQFLCDSKTQCISETLVCDGTENCEDKSDETLETCKNTKCPSHYFKCTYGACVELTTKCDGHKDCADNSDETHIDCPKIDTNITLNCRNDEVRCSNGQCISEDKLCDGKRDCNDGSDETVAKCYHWNCPRSLFKCAYGACIDIQFKCDGIQHCVDGSDESDASCNPITPVSKTTVRVTVPTPTNPKPKPTPKPPTINGVCEVPPVTADRYHTVYDFQDNPVSFEPGTKVPKNYKLTYTCSTGYFLNNRNTTVVDTFCTKTGWNVEIENCKRMCKPLQAINMALTCVDELNREITCPYRFLSGAKVRPYCKNWFRPDKLVGYKYLTCQNDGEWDDELFKCTAECGIPSATTLIYKGVKAIYGDSPWHVAIYNVEQSPYSLICGGTIVSQLMVISAAHCFYDEANSVKLDERNYEVVVSKLTRDYNKKDNDQQKVYKIKKIVYSTSKEYHPTTSNHASDIVVLVLQNVITITQWSLPACISWTDPSPFNPGESTPGKLVGWGISEPGSLLGSEILLAAELPFMSYNTCHKKLLNVDFDKFCAGSDDGAGARQGDSGGGLLFRNINGLYFLRGIVSTKDKYSNSSIATFTDLTYHTDWINKLYRDTEKQILKMETTIGSKS